MKLTEKQIEKIRAILADGEVSVHLTGKFPSLFMCIYDTEDSSVVFMPRVYMYTHTWAHCRTIGDNVVRAIQLRTDDPSYDDVVDFVIEEHKFIDQLREAVDDFKKDLARVAVYTLPDGTTTSVAYSEMDNTVRVVLHGDTKASPAQIEDCLKYYKQQLSIPNDNEFDCGWARLYRDSEGSLSVTHWTYTAELNPK